MENSSICERCSKKHDGSYGSGRFCSVQCANTRVHNNSTKAKIAKSLSRRKAKYCSCGTKLSYNNMSGYCKLCKPTAKSHAENIRSWRQNTKLKAIEYKGSKCIICGYNKCVRSLDFHHLDPSIKTSSISAMIVSPKKWETIKNELDKCVLVCSNCHGEIHDGLIIL